MAEVALRSQSKQYINVVTSVDPYWLADMGACFFSVREQNFSDRDRTKKATEFNKQAEMEMAMDNDREAAKAAQAQELALRNVANTPRIAGMGTPTPRRGGQTPRRRMGI